MGTGNAAPEQVEGDGTVMVSPRSAQLRKQLESQPENRDLLLQLASSLQADAKERPSPGLVMEAVQAYTKILQAQPKDSDALIGLAQLCFEAEIMDKAVEYYAKYLAVKPDDLQASTDYSLALIQGGDPQKAVAFLAPLAEAHPERFQMRLTLAVAEKLKGNKEQALEQANLALKNAPNEDAKNHIQDFIASIASAPNAEQIAASVSPASTIESYFQNHPIIGRKLVKITWPSASTVQVHVKEFPVEQMPPMAKEKFLTSAKKTFASFPDKIAVQLVDSGDGRELLSFTAGKEAGESTSPPN